MMVKLFRRISIFRHRNTPVVAAHALLDAARDGADIPRADIDAALVLTGDLDAALGAGIWAGLAQGVAA